MTFREARNLGGHERGLRSGFEALDRDSVQPFSACVARPNAWKKMACAVRPKLRGLRLEDGLAFHAFSCEYIANLLESRARLLPAASPLSLTRRQDLLELDLPEPNLSLYGVHDHDQAD